MSKLFFDHLVVLDDVEQEIKSSTESHEERHELWQIVDEIVHHRVFGCIFNHLPDEHHHDFMDKFHEAPYDESLLDFINKKIKGKIEEAIREETKNLASEILQEIKGDL